MKLVRQIVQMLCDFGDLRRDPAQPGPMLGRLHLVRQPIDIDVEHGDLLAQIVVQFSRNALAFFLLADDQPPG
jgi:hypothetical protein